MFIPHGAEIKCGRGGASPEDLRAATSACETHGFAVIRAAVAERLGGSFQREVKDIARVYDQGGPNWRRVYMNTEGWGRHRRDSFEPSLERFFPVTRDICSFFTHGLARAAYQRMPRTDIGLDVERPLSYINTLPRRGTVERHYDAEPPGVVIIFNVAGIARTELTDAQNTPLADFSSRPRDALILPGRVGDRGGPDDQAWHQVTNITPWWNNYGIRQSFVMVMQPAGQSAAGDNNAAAETGVTSVDDR